MQKSIKKVGITGPNGFLGRHTRWLLGTKKDEIEIVKIPIGSISDKNTLSELVRDLDVLVHLARIHPNDVKIPEDVYSGNLDLAKKIIEALVGVKNKPYIIFGSSTQINKDNPYGRAKKDIGLMFREWANKNKSKATSLIIPNEFGEGAVVGRISVVSTFCEDLLENRESKIAESVTIPLIHAQDVAKSILELIRSPKNEDVLLEGKNISISDIYKKLLNFKTLYYSDVLPNLDDSLDLALFNNLRWHILEKGFYPRKLNLKTDDRGSLFEIIKGQSGGQTFTSSTKPGITRGNHFHTRKVERFCVIKGQAQIAIREVNSDKIYKFLVDGDDPVYIDMPTFFTHNIKNVGKDELLTIFWSNEIFNQEDPDTYYETV